MHATHVFLIILCVLPLVASEKFEKRNKVKYCGRSLVYVLQVVCDGVYQGMFHKSSPPGASYEGKHKKLFKPKEEALKIRKKMRNRRGITYECCVQGCSVAELSTYCGYNN
uniref:Insulin-like domain-containing protein n=1 Tax=Clastoptera arizonana TaxID=38151 RepID=A0A1B6C0M2_9HEMI